MQPAGAPAQIPGNYMFDPTDEKLVQYLNMKINGEPIPPHVPIPINTVDVLGHAPEVLCETYKDFGIRDKIWYFFSMANEGENADGSWKFKDEKQIHTAAGVVVGHVRTFERKSRTAGRENLYILKEYVLPHNAGGANVFQPTTLCRLKFKPDVPPVAPEAQVGQVSPAA